MGTSLLGMPQVSLLLGTAEQCLDGLVAEITPGWEHFADVFHRSLPHLQHETHDFHFRGGERTSLGIQGFFSEEDLSDAPSH